MIAGWRYVVRLLIRTLLPLGKLQCTQLLHNPNWETWWCSGLRGSLTDVRNGKWNSQFSGPAAESWEMIAVSRSADNRVPSGYSSAVVGDSDSLDGWKWSLINKMVLRDLDEMIKVGHDIVLPVDSYNRCALSPIQVFTSLHFYHIRTFSSLLTSCIFNVCCCNPKTKMKMEVDDLSVHYSSNKMLFYYIKIKAQDKRKIMNLFR